MARTRRTAGVPASVKRTVKRVATRRTAGGGDLVKAVQGLVKALPIADLDKRLGALEKSVQRLESEIRKAVERVGGAEAGDHPSRHHPSQRDRCGSASRGAGGTRILLRP